MRAHANKLPDSAVESLGTVLEVAERLRVSRSSLYHLMDGGHLPYVKLGKSRRVRWSDVNRLIEKSTVGQMA